MGIPIPEFKVLLYGPRLNPAGQRARARFEGSYLTIFARGVTLTISAEQMDLKIGGYDGRQWLIVWTSDAGSYSAMLQGEDALDAFIHLAPTELSQQFLQARHSQTYGRHRFIRGAVWLALIMLLVLALPWFFSERLSEWAVSQINLEQEQQLGERLYEQLRPSLKPVEQGAVPDTVRAIGKRLTKKSNYRYQFHVVAGPQINAFALPGGHIVVYTGLLKATDSATELAGVLAHEISHVEKRHAIYNIVHALGLRAVMNVALGNFVGGIWNDMSKQLHSLNYDLELETEADMEGLQILQSAGITANGMETFFAKMAERENALLNLLARHPASEERLTTLRAAIEQASFDDLPPLNIDWERIKSAL